MNIIKNRDDINKIKAYFFTNNLIEELFLFDLSINSGIPISKLVSFKKIDLYYKGKNIKPIITISNKDYFISNYCKKLFEEKCHLSNNEYLFQNCTRTNQYNRSQFYKKLKLVEKDLGLTYSLSNKVCEFTFAYHYLLQCGNIDYLSYIFNKNRKQLIEQLFASNSDAKELFYI